MGNKEYMHFLRIAVGMGARGQDLELELIINFLSSSAFVGSSVSRVGICTPLSSVMARDSPDDGNDS